MTIYENDVIVVGGGISESVTVLTLAENCRARFVSKVPVMHKEEPNFIGPAAVLRAHRYIFDSRVANSEKRMKILEKPHMI